MILFCGIPSEPPLHLAIDAARSLGLNFEVLSQRDFDRAGIEVRFSSRGVEGTLDACGRRHRLEDFTGVYVRLMDPAHLPESNGIAGSQKVRESIEQARSRVFHGLFCEWLEAAPARVLNRLTAMASNMSKPLQAQAIGDCGFRVPPTLVTNDPAEAIAFLKEHPRAIYKSVSSVRSIVREAQATDVRRIARVALLATQFQAYVPGPDLRVHVIGRRIFATEVASEAIDYRYAGREGLDARLRPSTLSRSLKERCIALSESLELPFCGIDLRLASRDDAFCFEVNPSPAYSFYEEATGQPIAAALAAYLAGNRE
jgi:glutathione synthase/RimK-type ligase-like ATP-grasp enzyme